MTDNNWRELCAELMHEVMYLRQAITDELGYSEPESAIIPQVRTALAQPVPEGQASSDCLMRIAHAKPFVDWEFNIAHIFRRGLQGLPEDDGTQEWMENAVGICLGAVAEAAQQEPEVPPMPVPGAEVAPADRGSESSLAEFNDGGMPLG